MGYTIKVLNGYTLEKIETTMLEHTDENVRKVAKKYESEYGKLVDLDFSSDCIVIGKYENDMVLGFSI